MRRAEGEEQRAKSGGQKYVWAEKLRGRRTGKIWREWSRALMVVDCWLLVPSGTTLRVVEFLLAEMREHPGGSAQERAMFASVPTRVLAHFG
jgi:hypothetical protein